jgi:predicted acetyltransferase
LRAINVANIARPDHRFYIASLEEKAMGVALAIAEKETLGIYGVGTLPDHRRRGTSSALLAHAVREGRDAGAKTVTLQVMTGSYAESLYAKLGFETAFVSPIFVRGT